MRRIPRILGRLGLYAAACATFAAAAPTKAHGQAQSVPARLADSTFWRLMNEYSEPWGTFRSENFVSNETSLQWVIPELTRRIAPGGVYMGVAPDQNFTYITALKPSIAFIVDIRHQNAMQHLMYKALIETSKNRAEFLAALFARAPLHGRGHLVDGECAVRRAREAAGRQRALPDEPARDQRPALRVHRFALSDSQRTSLGVRVRRVLHAGPRPHLQLLLRVPEPWTCERTVIGATREHHRSAAWEGGAGSACRAITR